MAEPLAPGTRLGRFGVVRLLGAGGMGEVYEAHDPDLARSVALKVLRAEGKGNFGSLRLLREAQALAQLSHPNVVAVHDVGVTDGKLFLAMEYIEGQTLDAFIDCAAPGGASPIRRARRLRWPEILALFVQAGRG